MDKDKQLAGGIGRPPRSSPSAMNTPSKQGLTQSVAQVHTQTHTQTGAAGASTAPLKSILRTPTHEKPAPGGPLSSFSPSLSPIRTLLTTSTVEAMGDKRNTTSPSIFDDSHIEENDKDGHVTQCDNYDNRVNLSASLFMSPLHYDSSDADGSLQSLSLLNVTSNTTLATGGKDPHLSLSYAHPNSNQYSYSSRGLHRRKSSPARRFVRDY